MTGDDKTRAFASWLRGRGVELTGGELSLVTGLIALAGRRPVCADDIARGIELARGAAICEDAQLERLGALLLAFEAERGAADAPASAAPLQITIRTTAQVPVIAQPDATTAPAVRDRSARGSMSRRRARALAASALAVAAASAITGAVCAGRGSSSPARPPTALRSAPAERAQRLRRVGLSVRLPAGWREASDAELATSTGPPDATIVFRGATPADPDHGVFVAATAAHDDDLVAAARTAERGVIRQLGIAASAYQPGGCALIELGGGPAGWCSGVAEHRGARVAVEIYVRTVGNRSVVVLSLAKPSQAGAHAEAAAIAASLTP